MAGAINLSEYHQALRRAQSHAAIQAIYRAEIAPLGFSEAACGYFNIARHGAETVFYFQDWPPAWIELYTAENFVNHDFVVSEARLRLMPFLWSDIRASRSMTPGENRLWAAALPFGWTDGFCVPIHGPGGYFGLITTAGNPGPLDFAVRQNLHQISLLTHERCRDIDGIPLDMSGEDELTSRELECLRWVALGWDDRKIGQRLNISPLTVKDYLITARRKLGAETRAHAVAMLVARGRL